jgi:hypothetical protein
MKIYLAGGMTVMNVIGREREMSVKFDTWRRLFSYHYLILIYKSEILKIRHENILGSSGTDEQRTTG